MKEKKWINRSDIVFFIVAMLFVLLARTFIFTPVEVLGASMNPNLVDKERVFGLKIGQIKRLDVVSFDAPDEPELDYIKRVIGLPGDTVEYKGDVLYVNGEEIAEPYLDEHKAELAEGQQLTEDFTYTVPEGSYFVMGDNRQNSKDSRTIGPIKKERIVANAKVIFWPLNKIGMVK
ncbi:signal peptidase I [Enterococcus florum]|uniref:Signal peptidase I n=1 Tax=Enterococcus florum TaxID=2480627 RepID=A0A4P5PAN8_9ENTE|nr:signal peptidase I [Enterococcus florum]GCF95175.1 signal peptidase I [Enterococcus florum]